MSFHIRSRLVLAGVASLLGAYVWSAIRETASNDEWLVSAQVAGTREKDPLLSDMSYYEPAATEKPPGGAAPFAISRRRAAAHKRRPVPEEGRDGRRPRAHSRAYNKRASVYADTYSKTRPRAKSRSHSLLSLRSLVPALVFFAVVGAGLYLATKTPPPKKEEPERPKPAPRPAPKPQVAKKPAPVEEEKEVVEPVPTLMEAMRTHQAHLSHLLQLGLFAAATLMPGFFTFVAVQPFQQLQWLAVGLAVAACIPIGAALFGMAKNLKREKERREKERKEKEKEKERKEKEKEELKGAELAEMILKIEKPKEMKQVVIETALLVAAVKENELESITVDELREQRRSAHALAEWLGRCARLSVVFPPSPELAYEVKRLPILVKSLNKLVNAKVLDDGKLSLLPYEKDANGVVKPPPIPRKDMEELLTLIRALHTKVA